MSLSKVGVKFVLNDLQLADRAGVERLHDRHWDGKIRLRLEHLSSDHARSDDIMARLHSSRFMLDLHRFLTALDRYILVLGRPTIIRAVNTAGGTLFLERFLCRWDGKLATTYLVSNRLFDALMALSSSIILIGVFDGRLEFVVDSCAVLRRVKICFHVGLLWE